jgi:hypothetical protein
MAPDEPTDWNNAAPEAIPQAKAVWVEPCARKPPRQAATTSDIALDRGRPPWPSETERGDCQSKKGLTGQAFIHFPCGLIFIRMLFLFAREETGGGADAISLPIPTPHSREEGVEVAASPVQPRGYCPRMEENRAHVHHP